MFPTEHNMNPGPTPQLSNFLVLFGPFIKIEREFIYLLWEFYHEFFHTNNICEFVTFNWR